MNELKTKTIYNMPKSRYFHPILLMNYVYLPKINISLLCI